MTSILNSLLCCGRRKVPIVSSFDARYGASDITAPFDGAYASPPTKPPTPYEPNSGPKPPPNRQNRFSAGGPYGLEPVKVYQQPDSPKSVLTAISPSPQLSPAFSTGGTTAVTTPRTAIVSLPVHSAYIQGFSSSPPNSGNPLSFASASYHASSSPPPSARTFSASSPPPSAKTFTASSPPPSAGASPTAKLSSSAATTPTAPISPISRVASPPLRSMTPFERAASRQSFGGGGGGSGGGAGREREGERQIPTFVMATSLNSPPNSPPGSPPGVDGGLGGLAGHGQGRGPHVVIGEVPRRQKDKGREENEFGGSPDSEVSVEQWPGSM